MDLVVAKILALFIMAGGSLILGFLPLKVAKMLKIRHKAPKGGKQTRAEFVISCLLCFGGGVLLATAIIHMLPEVRASLTMVYELSNLPFPHFPIAEMILMSGFFLVFFVEEISSYGIKKRRLFTKNRSKERKATALKLAQSSSSMNHPAGFSNQFLAGSGNTSVTNLSTEHFYVPARNGMSPSLDRKSVEGLVTPVPPDTPAKQSFSDALANLMIIVALSFHAILEGFAVGLQERVADVWLLLLGVSIHEFVLRFCVGMELVNSGASLKRFLIYMIFYCSTVPMGIAVATILSANLPPDPYTSELVLAIFQGLAGGTLLYVTFFEILNREKGRDEGHEDHHEGLDAIAEELSEDGLKDEEPPSLSGIYRWGFILLGFTILTLLEGVVAH